MIQFNYKLRKQKFALKRWKILHKQGFFPAISVTRKKEIKKKNRRDATNAFQFLPPPCLQKNCQGKHSNITVEAGQFNLGRASVRNISF